MTGIIILILSNILGVKNVANNIYVIIPSLNPDEKLKNTVRGMLDAGFERIIIVNDGSDNEHLENFPHSDENITVIHRRQNHGKGAALKVAFRHILRNCPDAAGVVTVDGDGQHSPQDAAACAAALDGIGKGAVLGCRDFSGEDVPKRSRMGNHTTSFVFKVLCGMEISDTQTGLRAFPVSLLPLLLSVKGDRFEYETNMLLKFRQCGVKIKEVPIETVYIEENATSHFRPIQDSLRIYRFIIVYFLSSAISFVADLSVFYLAMKLLGASLGKWAELTATAIARAISSVINYNINRTKVFNADSKSHGKLARYYALAIPQMFISAGLVTLVSHLLKATPFLATVIKLIIDTVIFFVNYRIQQTWVFAETKENKSAGKKSGKKLTAGTVVKRTLLSVGTALAMVLVFVISAALMICYGPSKSLRNMTVIMAKEASATKWIPTLFLPASTVNKIIADSEKVNVDVIGTDDYGKTAADEWDDAVDGMKLIYLNEPKFKGYILLIRDPKRVSVGASSENYASAAAGARIFDIAQKYNCIAAKSGSTALPVEKNGTVYNVVQEFAEKEAVGKLAGKAASVYAEYMQNDSSMGQIRKYMDTDTKFYKNLRTSLVIFALDHEKHVIKDLKTTDFHKYSDNLFSCRVTLINELTRRGEKYQDKFDKYVYLRRDGDTYKVLDMQNTGDKKDE